MHSAIDSKANPLSIRCAQELSGALDGKDFSSPLEGAVEQRGVTEKEGKQQNYSLFSALLVVCLLAGLIGLMVVVVKGGGKGGGEGSPRRSPKRKGKKKNHWGRVRGG